MRFKLFVFLIFSSLASSLAQEVLPICEASTYVHGSAFDEFKLTNSMSCFVLKDGSVIVSTYNGKVVQIKNTRMVSLNRNMNFGEYPIFLVEKGDSTIFFGQFFISVLYQEKEIYNKRYSSDVYSFGEFRRNEKSNCVYFVNTNEKKQERSVMYCVITNFELKTVFDLEKPQNLLCAQSDGAMVFDAQSNDLITIKQNGEITKSQLPHNHGKVSYVNFQDALNYHYINEFGLGVVRNGKVLSHFAIPVIFGFQTNKIRDKHITILNHDAYRSYSLLNDTIQLLAEFPKNNDIRTTNFHQASNSMYLATSGDLLQVFPHIKKYPRLFANSNTNSVFSLHQDPNGSVHAGSYNKCLSTIVDNKRIETSFCNFPFVSQGTSIDGVSIIFPDGSVGVYAMTETSNSWIIADSITAFCALKTRDGMLYIGTFNNGLWYAPADSLQQNKLLKWEKKTRNDGIKIQNILSMAEDKYGNIWMVQKGVAVYHPSTEKIKAWHAEENEKHFSSRCVVADHKGVPWFGTFDGRLFYYQGKDATDFSFDNFKNINHPFLNFGQEITFLHQWRNHLIIGATDKVLLFDLQKWYESNTVAVRYLNPRELHLSSSTEQNTVFTDFRDSSVWFATADMVYQWDISTWLQIPTNRVEPSIILKSNSIELVFSANQNIILDPTENSFELEVYYQTPDNMPRYINANLTDNDDSLVFSASRLEHLFRFDNLSSGNYVFRVQVCQQDGSVDVFEFPIRIKLFLWQNWWFWFALFLVVLSIAIFIFIKQNAIERTKRKVSVLNLTNLSNQFRPHFMLNALNSIGSQLEDKPHAEKVISRLGVSINLFIATHKATLLFTVPNKNGCLPKT